MNGQPNVVVKGLHVTYRTPGGEVRALRGIDLALFPGRITAVIGESGSGKTTLARTMLKALPVSADVRWDVLELPKRIASVQQEPVASLHPLVPVGAQITDILAARKKVKSRVARTETLALLTAFDLTDPEVYYKRYAHQLSGGQAQRVSLARALALGAEFLVVDEPTSQLDLLTQAEAVKQIYRVTKQEALCTLFITHNLALVAEIADDVLVLLDGEVVEQGGVTSVFHAPVHPYTQKLLSELVRLDQGLWGPGSKTEDGVRREVQRV